MKQQAEEEQEEEDGRRKEKEEELTEGHQCAELSQSVITAVSGSAGSGPSEGRRRRNTAG